MTVMTTYIHMNAFLNSANGYLKDAKATKFAYAVRKTATQVAEKLRDVQDLLEDLNINFCATDPKTGIILRGPNGEYQYLKDQLKSRFLAQKELFAAEVEVECHCVDASIVPSDLTHAQLEAFEGFVIPSGYEAPELKS